MTSAPAPRSHWPRHARSWAQVGSPLRPHVQDVRLVQALADEAHPAAARVLLLGVTPEYAAAPWPEATVLTAVDKCPDMIEHVWPREVVPSRFTAVCGDWCALPLADGSQDVVIGDGVTTVLPSWATARQLMRELHRVTHARSRVLLRLFIRPDAPDTPEQVWADLRSGALSGFHAFKLRLLMSLQAELSQGVRPALALQAWRERLAADPALRLPADWGAATRATIEAYDGSPDVYWFPTLAELIAVTREFFTVERVAHSSYELADRCPVVVLQRLP